MQEKRKTTYSVQLYFFGLFIYKMYMETINQLDSCNNKNGIWKKYYSNGELKNECKYRNGTPTGFWKHYFENGQLKSEGKYINGKKAGTWKYYFENGEIKEEVQYLNGNKIKSV